MRSPSSRFGLLFRKELLFLVSSKAFLCSLVLAPLLVGYSFAQAVDLFSEASRSAVQFKDLAQGMNPFEGVFVPSWGALYLLTTFLFPFVAIRSLSEEKASGSLKILFQLLPNGASLVAIKFGSVLAVWFLMILPALFVVPIWMGLGGHVYWPEVANLLLGHFLYAVAIAGFAFFASAISDSTSTAAILVLAFTLLAWVLDFNLTGNTWGLSLTNNLRAFERGLFASPQMLRMLLLGIGFLACAGALLERGWSNVRKGKRIGSTILGVGLVYALTSQVPFYRDLREDKRNSFAPEDERALSTMTRPLRITVFMTPDDSRYRDFDRKVLSKLQRLLPRVSVDLPPTGKLALFGTGTDSRYGQIELRYGEKTESTLSNSPEEILPLLYRLSGITPPQKTPVQYSGYPLIAELGRWDLLFYFFIPLLYAAGWGFIRSRRFNPFRRTPMKQPILALAVCLFCTLGYGAKPTTANLLPLNTFSEEKAGGEPTSFSPAVGHWSVGTDEGKNVLIVDGSKWEEGKASATIAEKAKAIYGERYAEFLDNVKAYAYFPFAVANYVDDFTDGEISVSFKPIAGRIDQAGGILFNVKSNGDYLILRANALEQNLVLFKYVKGKRTRVKWISEVPVPAKKWQELKLVVKGKDVSGYLDGKEYLKHTLPEPVSGKVGLWSKADSVTYFRDFSVKPAKTNPKG